MKLKTIIQAALLSCASTLAAAQTVQIGVPAIQSGAMAQFGANFVNGVNAAVQEVNAAGGITVGGKRHKVEAAFCDTQGDSAKSAACGRRLSSQNKVSAMVMATSIETFPIIGFNATSNPPFVVVTSSASNKLVQANNPLVVRYWYNTYSYMPGLTAKFAQVFKSEGRKTSKVGFMQSEDEFGKAWVETFSEGWKKAGGQVGALSTWVIGATDFYPQLTSLLRDKPDLIGLPGACPTIAPIIKQSRELGFTGDFIVDLACDPHELGKFVKADQYKNSYFLGSQWNLDSAAAKRFREQYAKVSKTDPTVISVDGYGQTMLVLKAMEKAGTITDASKIRQSMGEVLAGDWNLLGISNLQANGETTANVFPRRFLDAGKMDNLN
ncbi:ABC transporter substrate-binding protein [Ottowia thiooxydans]|uniref:ABC transporter substrate-binding protein n=1 Tax=Ottowia thiooxydans TaxID=219182 RepID=UPI00040E00B9|nr:ABC transporter substrate-binding protein [Ottowia thiooxydans]